MPIFEYQGKTYDVADQYIDSFAEEFPDAKTMIDQDGNNYSVKSKYYKDFLNEFSVPRPEIQKAMATTYSIAPEPSEGAEEVNPIDLAKGSGRAKISVSKPQQNEAPSTPIQAEPIRKFGEGVKQGYTGIIAGSKYGIGEAAEKIVGTRNDDYEALKKIAQLEAEGKDVAEEAQKEYAHVENINPLLSGILKITGGGEAIGEVEKNAQANRTIRKVLEETGGDIEKAKLLLGARAGQSTYADKMRDYAAAKMAQARPTKGWATVGALVPQMAGNVVGLGLSAITKMPVFAQVLGNVNTGVLTASSAGQAMAEARQAGASNAQVWGAGLVNGLVEKVTEDYQLNNRYVKRLVDAVKGRASKQLVDAVSEIGSPANKEMQDLLARANKRLGGKLFSGKNVADYLGDVVSEGSSEFTAEALQTIAPILYENKEDYPTLMQALEAGVEGFKGGVLMGGFMGGISKTAEHRMNRDRRKAQGYVKVAEITDNNNNTEVVEVVRDNENPDQEVFYWNGEKIPILDANVRQVQTFSFDDFERGRIELENDEAYENGRSLESPEEKSDATTALDVATQEFRERFGLGEDGDVDTYLGANPYETARLEYDKDPELGQVALNYIYAKSNVDGIIDSTKDQIKQRISEATSLIDSRINKTDGMIHPAILRENGKPVYIIDGDVKMFDDGSINTQESPESIIIVDAETMKPEFIAPSVLSKADAPIDPNVEKESVRSTITEAIATQTENEMNGVQPFNIGDVYPIIDTDGTERTVQVVANDGNGNVQVLFNGEQEPTQATINDIQQLIDTSRRNRYMIAQEANKAMEDAQIAENIEANDSDAETMPEVTLAPVKREVPMQKNGQPDFNAMDAEMFVDEYVNRYGEDSATKLARKNISVAREAIAKIDKKMDDVVDPNQMEALSQQKDAAQAQLDRYIDILGRLGATDNETEAEEKSR
ncbi:MAG: hypothetical protein II226_09520, partial [Alistipes sp.]|nr:hypothetical protein [Alistipes sp.]